MSDEKIEEVKSEAASTPAPEAVAEAPKEQPTDLPKATDYVDFDEMEKRFPGSKAYIKPRFDHIYAHMKEHGRRADMLDEQNKELTARFSQLEERMEKSETVTVQRRVAGEIAVLQTQYQKAMEAGEYGKAAAINTQMLSKMLTAEKTVAAKPPEPEKPRPNGIKSPHDYIIEQWASERDDDGNLKRPWTEDGHPKQRKAAALTNALLVDPDWNSRPLPEILAEVERQMSPASRPAASVLAPGSAKPPAGDKLPRLSAAEQNTAEKMYPGLSVAKAHERYAASKKLLGKV